MSEFPFIGLSTPVQETNLPLFQELSWDFDSDKFIYDGNGNHVIVTGNDAVKVWIYKALKTERFRYLSYSLNYGCEMKTLVGRVMSVGERISELKRYIRECLLVNPYIKTVESIEITSQENGRELEIVIVLTTVYGSLIV